MKSFILKEISERIGISKSALDRLKTSYGAVGKWLADSEIINQIGDVVISPQGSIGLGTAIKPISEEDEYDVDLICEIKNPGLKQNVKLLKLLPGYRLKENKLYEKAEEHKRCWTLDYENYHMDILPCCPDNAKANYLVATQKEANGEYIAHSTNPIEYRRWFLNRGFNNLFEQYREINPIEDFDNKSDLQRIVQLLKRHRDMWISNNKINVDDKPISIIITTLAAYGYKGFDSLFDALLNCVSHMKDNIKYSSGIYVISNPVDQNENFADKWITNKNRQKIFFMWLEALITDINALNECSTPYEFIKLCKELFGEKVSNESSDAYFSHNRMLREEGKLYVDENGILNDKFGNKVRDHRFYGD